MVILVIFFKCKEKMKLFGINEEVVTIRKEKNNS